MKTKILLLFCALLLTAAPAMAVNIRDFNIVTPNGSPELSGMFSIDFDDPNQTPSSIMLSIDGQDFSDTDLNFTEAGLIFLVSPGGAELNIQNYDNNGMFIPWSGKGGMHLEYTLYNTPNCPERDSCFRITDTQYARKGKVAPVPEPATMMLLSTGLVGLLGYRWRQGRREGQQVG